MPGEGWPDRFARKRPPTVGLISGAGSKVCGRPAVPGEGWPDPFARKSALPQAIEPGSQESPSSYRSNHARILSILAISRDGRLAMP